MKDTSCAIIMMSDNVARFTTGNILHRKGGLTGGIERVIMHCVASGPHKPATGRPAIPSPHA